MIALARLEAATERLYGLLPAHIRTIDAANGWALKALVQVLAAGGVEIDQQIDALYDSMFVETAPEAALADLAALVASEPLRPLPPGAGRNARAFIANTVRYRRGKGTARVLEGLAADVGGFGGVAVEYFMRLARTQNLIDLRPERPGLPALVPGVTAARTATGFDALPRLLDVRSIARLGGRHHQTHVGVHLLRPIVPNYSAPEGDGLAAAKLAKTPKARPWPVGGVERPGYFQLSAQPGRPLRLFNPDRRSASDGSRIVETDLPDRLHRLPLHLETQERRHAALEGRPPVLGDTPWFDELGQPFTIFLRKVGATTFDRTPPAQVRIANLEAPPPSVGARPQPTLAHAWFTGGASAVAHAADHPIRCAFDPVTGRLIASEPAAGQPDVEEVRVAHGLGVGREIGAGPHDRNGADVPFDVTDTVSLTNLIWLVDATLPADGPGGPSVRQVRTLATALAEWTAAGLGKRGLIVLTRCEREGAPLGQTEITVAVHPGSELHIVAAEWRPKEVKPGVPDNPDRRGYIVRRERRFTLDAPVRIVAAAAPPAGGEAGVLVLDGLELIAGLSLGVRAVSRLWVRHCTVRKPGGVAIGVTAPLQGAEIILERTISGRIALEFGGGPAVGALTITGSIVSPDGAAAPAISAINLDGQLRDVTVLGVSRFKSLEATNVIFVEAAEVVRRQAGCVRYSVIAPGSSMPRRFRCQPDLAQAAASARKQAPLTLAENATVALGVTPLFLDTDLDEPTVAMLHPLASDGLRLGGEGDSEMGAFSVAAEGLRMANLTSLFDDFLPFGLEAGLIDDTRSSAIAARRNRP